MFIREWDPRGPHCVRQLRKRWTSCQCLTSRNDFLIEAHLVRRIAFSSLMPAHVTRGSRDLRREAVRILNNVDLVTPETRQV